MHLYWAQLINEGLAPNRISGLKAAGPIGSAADTAFRSSRQGVTEMGFFRTAYKNLTEARQRQADRFVAGALLRLDDASLNEIGKSRAELTDKRPGRTRL
tara:strand:- start:196 stop:495 length:300 start_codon:yes stop_codon:yes gene_type:complete